MPATDQSERPAINLNDHFLAWSIFDSTDALKEYLDDILEALLETDKDHKRFTTEQWWTIKTLIDVLSRPESRSAPKYAPDNATEFAARAIGAAFEVYTDEIDHDERGSAAYTELLKLDEEPEEEEEEE